MPALSILAVLASLAGVLLPAAAQPARTVALPPAEHFVQPQRMVDAVISPSGKRVAVILGEPGGGQFAAVFALDDPRSEPKAVASHAGTHVRRIAWVNDDRLVYEARPPGYEVHDGTPSTVAIDHDGGNERVLIVYTNEDTLLPGTSMERRRRVLAYPWHFSRTAGDGSDDVMVLLPRNDGRPGVRDVLSRVARLNTKTGEMKALDAADPPPSDTQWSDATLRETRMVSLQRDGRLRLHWRKPGTRTWKQVLDQPLNDADTFNVLALEGEHAAVVEARRAGADTTALFTLDLPSGRLDAEPLLALKGFDLEAGVVMDGTGSVLGVRTRAAQPLTVWFDERMQSIQQSVDAVLPGRANRISCGSRCARTSQFVVHSQSARHPGEYFHYDHERRTLRLLGKSRPWLDEATQGRRTFHRIDARDGLSLPVVVTHPAAHAPSGGPVAALPAVLLVHDGPWRRGADLGWAGEAQFLASRGYRVLEVDFRGSTGFGWRHFAAGMKQWGSGMMDDLADAVKWASREGLIDRERVCVVGSRFGGYASLMAPVRHAGLFRCAASFAAWTDVEAMYADASSHFFADARRFELPVLVGHPKDDAPMLAAASPIRRVAELKVPVLLAHGAKDRRTPPADVRRFVDAANAAGALVEQVTYDGDSDVWWGHRNHADFLRRLEVFLARHLNAQPASPTR